MTSAPIPLNQPNAAAVRAQVERMTASTVFRNSPQLATFLWFIVEAQLRGKGERLKGYTIGVEVLRRDTNFDPQVDPIVRVEATRLRRAIERYYVGPGVSDTIMISLPRGGYVPRIGWRTAHDDVDASHKADAASPPKPGLLPGNGMPTLRVAPFVVIGTPQTRAVSLEAIGGKLAEAFALFEIINVLAAAPPQPATRSDYRLDGVIEYRGETVDLRFRLIDESDATVIWSRAFEGVSCTDDCEEIEQRHHLAACHHHRSAVRRDHRQRPRQAPVNRQARHALLLRARGGRRIAHIRSRGERTRARRVGASGRDRPELRGRAHDARDYLCTPVFYRIRHPAMAMDRRSIAP